MHKNKSTLSLLFFIVCLLLGQTVSAIETLASAKQIAWDQMSQQIDERISYAPSKDHVKLKKTVVALQLLGAETLDFSDGSLDSLTPYPWIHVWDANPQSTSLLSVLMEATEQYHKEFVCVQEQHPEMNYEDMKSIPSISELFQKVQELETEWKKLKQTHLQPLHSLLQAFYAQRNCAYDCMLVYSETDMRLQNVGASWQFAYTPEERQQKLFQYQQEMEAFGEFVANYYFQLPETK